MTLVSPLMSAPFQQVTLVFQGEGEYTGRDPVTGQPVFTPGERVELTALFSPFKREQLQFRTGADADLIAGEGELLSPLQFPQGITIGSTGLITYAGRPWHLKIMNIIENDLVGVPLGTYYQADLTPAEPEPDDEGGTP